MKKTFSLLLVFIIPIFIFTSCKPEPVDPTVDPVLEEPLYETLERTEWEGAYLEHVNTLSHGSFDVIIHWTVDFLADGKGEVMLWLESPSISADVDTYEFTYSYNGDNTGVLDLGGARPFTIDAYNRTMTAKLTFDAEFEEGTTTNLGGETVLHQVR